MYVFSALLLPTLRVADIGDDFVNITWTVEKNDDKPAGSIHFVKYRKKGKFPFICQVKIKKLWSVHQY